MLDKLFVRVRSWLHTDPAAASPVTASGLAGVPGPAIANANAKVSSSSSSSTEAKTTKAARAGEDVVAPPPAPAEAFSLVMEAQPESGMVITESGIIIIDPNAEPAAASAEAPKKSALTANPSDAWALPNAPVVPVTPSRGDSYGDWDTVLARARAQLSTSDKPSPKSGK
jgi:hypothetical protein